MALLDSVLIPGATLPKDSQYDNDFLGRLFWRLSYRCGRDYMEGKDARGRAILYEHEREKPDSITRRKRVTKPRNHCGPIIRRYNDFVFRHLATRPYHQDDAAYDQFHDDCTGMGMPLSQFMRRALLKAQVDREMWILCDSTKASDAPEMTVAQADRAGVRKVLRMIDADSVLWWWERDGSVMEVLVILQRETGEWFVRYFTADSYRDIQLKNTGMGASTAPNPMSFQVPGGMGQTVAATGLLSGTSVQPTVDSVGPWIKHGWPRLPMVRLRPLFDDASDGRSESQISPLAELQQDIVNLLSLQREEHYNSTFTQYIATGVDAESIKDLSFGNNRVLCLANAAAKFDAIGADPAQSSTIQSAIEATERELYRLAGVATGDPLLGPGDAESGVAKAFKFNDLAANLASLADACQFAENLTYDLLFPDKGYKSGYPTDFDLPSFSEELEAMIRVLTTTQIPRTLRQHIVRSFGMRNCELSDDEQKSFEDEVDAIGEPAAPGAGLLPAKPNPFAAKIPPSPEPDGDEDTTADSDEPADAKATA